MSIAIYAGTFDPITAGHVSVIRQAARLFSHVVVVVAVNPNKKTLLTPNEQVELVRALARDIGASVLLRGIRGATDAEFETQLARGNKQLAPEVSTLFLPAEEHLAEVSSSALKEKVARGEDVSSYCAPAVEAVLRARIPTTEERGVTL